MAGDVEGQEKMNGAKGLNLSPGSQIRILTSHLAYVARAEIKMSILSFPLYSFGANAPVCRSDSPLSTPFLEGE